MMTEEILHLDLLLLIRTWAIWSKSKVILVILSILWLAEVVLGISAIYFLNEPSPALMGPAPTDGKSACIHIPVSLSHTVFIHFLVF